MVEFKNGKRIQTKKPDTESSDFALTLENGISDGVNQCLI
jgi:hypothetical protein